MNNVVEVKIKDTVMPNKLWEYTDNLYVFGKYTLKKIWANVYKVLVGDEIYKRGDRMFITNGRILG